MFYVDWTYIILVLPFVIFSFIASSRVNSTFDKYAKVYSRRGLTAADAAREVLRQNGVYDVRIEHVQGKLSDHYDPKANVIRLSDSTINSTSVAAIGVACHEAGHALQYAENYSPIKFRTAIIPITNIGSKLAIPLIIVGIALSHFGEMFSFIAYAGVVLFGFAVLFQLITLPVEFNASRRAMNAITEHGILYEDEAKQAKETLSAAAMTYVAALAVTFMQFLRILLIVSGNSGKKRR